MRVKCLANCMTHRLQKIIQMEECLTKTTNGIVIVKLKDMKSNTVRNENITMRVITIRESHEIL